MQSARRDVLDFLTPHFKKSIDNFSKGRKPMEQCVVVGSFGLYALLVAGYPELLASENNSSLLQPADIDVRIVTNFENMRRVGGLWKSRLSQFVSERPEFELKSVIRSTSKMIPDPEFSYSTAAYLQLSFRGEHVMDMVVTDEVLKSTQVNLKISRQIGMPVLRLREYLKSMMHAIHGANVPGVHPHLHDKRGLLAGPIAAAKGSRDIARAKLLCKALGRVTARACTALNDGRFEDIVIQK